MEDEGVRMRTLKDFLNDPYEATLYGFQPSYMDCLCFASTWFGSRIFKASWKTFLELGDWNVKQFPMELIKFILTLMMVLTIPFGGFFIIGTLSRFFTFRPKVLGPMVKSRKDAWDLQW